MKIVIATLIYCFLIFPCNYSAAEENHEDKFIDEVVSASVIKDPEERLLQLERLLERANNYQKYVMLGRLSRTAMALGQTDKARLYAEELLQLSKNYKDGWNYGNAIHDGNMILGLVALKLKDIDKAKSYLLEAGNAPQSPQIKNFGPNMLLAESLLQAGERDTVLTYLNKIKTIWTKNDGRVDSWIAAIKGGGMPYFGDNLRL